MFLLYLFHELSPIQFPLEFILERSKLIPLGKKSILLGRIHGRIYIRIMESKKFQILVSSDSLETDKDFVLLGF